MMRRKELIVLFFVIVFLSFSLTAQAAERKGFFIRLWDRIKARITRQEIARPEKEVKPAEEKIPAEKKMPEEKKAPAEKEEKPPKKERKMPSKEDMLDTIKRRLQVFSEIVDMFPNLTRREAEEGVEYYYITSDGVALNIEELDKETLYKLYVKVNQHATRIHTERLLRQIRQQEQLRRLQNLQRIPRQPAQPPRVPTQPPKVYTPPKGPPLQPSAPPAVPGQRR